ncbi:MAG: hypothetical protein KDD82_13715 [Planctomycetes bacterium]|nr:hypothetical protein [Planctomycetota bacterium]
MTEPTPDPQAFDPKQHWDALRSAMEQGGPPAVVAFVEGDFTPKQQRALYLFCVNGFCNREWAGKALDPQIEVARAGIALGLRQAEAEADPKERDARIDFANVLSYNLAANLAPCWPGDDVPRERRHLEAGLEAAEACLRWREQLGKGPFPFSIAWWAKGMHELALGRDAVASMREALEAARAHARAEGKPDGVADGWLVALSAGYLGLAERAAGGDGARYAEAKAALDGMLADPEGAEDAQFCLDQLAVAEARIR